MSNLAIKLGLATIIDGCDLNTDYIQDTLNPYIKKLESVVYGVNLDSIKAVQIINNTIAKETIVLYEANGISTLDCAFLWLYLNEESVLERFKSDAYSVFKTLEAESMTN